MIMMRTDPFREVERLSREIFGATGTTARSEEHTSELQSRFDLVCRLRLEKNNAGEGAYRGAEVADPGAGRADAGAGGRPEAAGDARQSAEPGRDERAGPREAISSVPSPPR